MSHLTLQLFLQSLNRKTSTGENFLRKSIGMETMKYANWIFSIVLFAVTMKKKYPHGSSKLSRIFL